MLPVFDGTTRGEIQPRAIIGQSGQSHVLERADADNTRYRRARQYQHWHLKWPRYVIEQSRQQLRRRTSVTPFRR